MDTMTEIETEMQTEMKVDGDAHTTQKGWEKRKLDMLLTMMRDHRNTQTCRHV